MEGGGESSSWDRDVEEPAPVQMEISSKVLSLTVATSLLELHGW